MRSRPVRIFSVSPIRSVADLASVADAAGASLFSSRSCGHNRGLRIFGLLADNVANAIYSIGAPQHRAWSTDHFNSVDILEQYVLDIPIHAGKQRRIHASAVDQHQQLVVEPAVKSARRDRPFVRVDACYFQSWREPQRFGNAPRPRAPDIFLGAYKNRGRGVRHPLRSLAP